MRHLRKPLSLLLVLCMMLSLTIPAYAAGSETDAPSEPASDTPVTASAETETEEDPAYVELTSADVSPLAVTQIEITSAEQFMALFADTSYTSSDTLELTLVNDITLSGSITDCRNPAAISIDGNGNTMYGDGSNAMIAPSSATYMKLGGLTFTNITVDAKDQQFFACALNWTSGGPFTLTNVKLCNLRGSSNTRAGIDIESNTGENQITIDNVTTEGCTGVLFSLRYVPAYIVDSKLSVSSYSGGGNTRIFYLYNGGASHYNRLTVENSELSVDDPIGAQSGVAIYAMSRTNITLDGCTITGVSNTAGSGDIYLTGLSTDEPTTLEIVGNGLAMTHTDGTDPSICVESGKTMCIIRAAIQGEPIMRLGSDGCISLPTELTSPLKFEFASSYDISKVDPAVVEGYEDYEITEADLEKLTYNDPDCCRVLQMTREEDETNVARFYRVDLAEECDVELLNWDYLDSEGRPAYKSNINADGVQPEVQVIYSATGKVISQKGNYTLTYSSNKVTASDTPDTEKSAYVTVAPDPDGTDLIGNTVREYFTILVLNYDDLSGSNAPVSVELVYDVDEDTWSIVVSYDGVILTEGVDYTVSCIIDSDDWTAVITITGMGDYGGTRELTVSLPGRDSKIRTVYDEPTLDAALNDKVGQIIITSDIALEDPAVIDYDCILTSEINEETGEPFTISAGGLLTTYEDGNDQAVISVSPGNTVTLDGINVDGSGQARLLYAGENANVELTGGTVVTNGGISGSIGNTIGLVVYIEDGATLTLRDCELSHSLGIEFMYPIYNLGTLNVEEGAYLTQIGGSVCAINNHGILNWTGGIFNISTNDLYAGSTGAVIYNSGTFNLSEGEINGFLLDNEGNYTAERSTAYDGAVFNDKGATFNMSGGTITGVEASGDFDLYSNDWSLDPSGGGGVCNRGMFVMEGGTITDNSAYIGGGVLNEGVFYLNGGTISNNSASLGGGIFNDCAREATINLANSEFYMTGGSVAGNKVTNATLSSETTGEVGMNDGESGITSSVGSEIYVAGGSKVVISGGTITGDDSVTVSQSGNEALQEEEIIGVGIAVVPTIFTIKGMTANTLYTNMSPGTLTITEGPTIEVGIVLVNYSSSTQEATLDKEAEGFDPTDAKTYKYTPVEGTEVVERENMSWLELDGNLKVPLTVSTLDRYNAIVQFENVSNTENIYTTISNTQYRVNQDGNLIAGYDSRVIPDEADKTLLKTDASIYQTYKEFELTGSANRGETTYDEKFSFEAWVICNHTNLEHMDRVEPTCTEEGTREYWICTECLKFFADDEAKEELTADEILIPANGHTLVDVGAVEPTCTEPGHEAGEECTVCGGLFDKITGEELPEIEALGHDYVLVERVEPTATEDGHTAGVQCARCGEWMPGFKAKYIPATSGADKTALKAAIDAEEALDLDESAYTTETWEALQDALTAANEVIADETATQTQVNEALTELMNAIEGLKKNDAAEDETDTTALEMAVSTAESLNEGSYTAKTWTALQEALTAANKILESGSTEQEEADAAVTAVREAIEGLERVPAEEQPTATDYKYALEQAVAYADGLNKDDYTEKTWSGVETALAAADSVLQNSSAIQAEVDSAFNDLMTAILNLEQASTEKSEPDTGNFTGFKEENGGWYYYVNGALQSGLNSVIQGTVNGTTGWWYVVGGKAQTGYTGVCDYSNEYGWWYVVNGKVDFGKTGIEPNSYGWWRVVEGKVDFSCNSVEQNDYGWWYLTGGQVQFGYTGVANYANAYGWWYIKNGQVDFSCNSVEQNNYGWWYVLGGKVDFSYTGVANYANAYGWWYIKNGQVDFSCNSVEQNNYGWWYVTGGKVDFSYTGLASNSYGTWYIRAGKVDFSYNGTYNGRTIVAGKAV